MKVRFLTQLPFLVGFGGLEEQAQKYMEHIRRLHPEDDVDFLRWDETKVDILHILGLHAGINPYIVDVLKRKGTKIVLSSVFYLQPDGWRDFRRPIVYRLCSYIPHHIAQWMRSLARGADVILPNSDIEGRQVQEVFGTDPSRIFTIYNGIEPNLFDGVDPEKFRVHYGLDRYILCASHCEPRKNQVRLIKAFLSLDISHRLVLTGTFRGNYYQYHEEIRRLIADHPDRILATGFLSVELLRSAYLGADVHILASTMETTGISSLEAGLAGCPLVVGECPPVREYFGEFATFVDPYSESSIAEGIRAELHHKDHNPQSLHRQSASIASRYAWGTIAENVYSHYQKLLHE